MNITSSGFIITIFIYHYNDICVSVSRLIKHRCDSKSIFLKWFLRWDRQDLSFAGSLDWVLPIFPSEKVGCASGYTPKMMISESNWDQISNFRLLFLSTQKELCAQISRAIGLGIKVLFLHAVGDNGYRTVNQLTIADNILEVSWR